MMTFRQSKLPQNGASSRRHLLGTAAPSDTHADTPKVEAEPKAKSDAKARTDPATDPTSA